MNLLRPLNKAILSLLVVALYSSVAAGGEVVEIVNTTPEPIHLFLWKSGATEFSKPIYLARTQSTSIDIQGQDRFYIVYKDPLHRAINIGWVHLLKVAGPTRRIGINTVYQQNGWLRGWKIDVTGQLIPDWIPDGDAYAWTATLRPLVYGEPIFSERELLFRNARHLKASVFDVTVFVDPFPR